MTTKMEDEVKGWAAKRGMKNALRARPYRR